MRRSPTGLLDELLSIESMSAADSITDWIAGLRDGDSAAAENLWHRYFQQMVTQARKKLQGASRSVVDEEDVALSAFNSFCAAARDGRFPRLHDRQGLWPLLMSIVAHKSVDVIRHQNRLRRNSGATVASSDLLGSFDDFVSHQPSPEISAMLADEVALILRRLGEIDDPSLRQIVVLKLEGIENSVIANQIGCARRTIERKIRLIRQLMLTGALND